MRGFSVRQPPYRLCSAASAAGFSLLELMVVVAILAVLALIAVPNFTDKFVREQIVDSVKLADIAKAPIAVQWAAAGTMPVDNGAAGLPPAVMIVNNYISAVAVESGAIQITFGNHANPALQGKTLSLRPGVIESSTLVPVAWVCGFSEPPVNMVVKGLNKTNIAPLFLPSNCRSLGSASSPSG
jgi:type IV pilus assembly protein PilA